MYLFRWYWIDIHLFDIIDEYLFKGIWEQIDKINKDFFLEQIIITAVLPPN